MIKLTPILLGLTFVIAFVACDGGPAEPYSDIGATVEAMGKELVAEQVNNLPPNPDLAVDYFNRASGYLEAGLPDNWQSAIRDYTKAIELGIPTSGYSGRNYLADTYNNRGLAYRRLDEWYRDIRKNKKSVQNYMKAIQDYDNVIQLDPDNADVYYNRGVANRNLGQHQRAIQDYDQAIRLKPTAWLYNNRGYAYYNLGQDEKADADKAKACSLDSQWC